LGRDFGLCFNPEFLREGSSIKDYYNPPFTIVGGDSEKSVQIMKDLFNNVNGDFIKTQIKTAEMVKYCCNVFHSLKITFANEIGRLSKQLEVDAREVMELLCRDNQLNISSAYLKPGFSFGGSCLPKDLRSLLYIAKMNDVHIPMISNILLSNQIHIDHTVDMILQTGLRSIGLVGLSFKGGTDDLRESPFVILAERFIGKGLSLKIYDPHVSLSSLIGANRQYIENTIPHIAKLFCNNPEELIKDCEVLIIGQNDRKFLTKLYDKGREDLIVFDILGVVRKEKIRGIYRGICW
jgi:GDP-mannose 6-dehydrogenase